MSEQSKCEVCDKPAIMVVRDLVRQEPTSLSKCPYVTRKPTGPWHPRCAEHEREPIEYDGVPPLAAPEAHQ